jgi:hypothetical protein
MNDIEIVRREFWAHASDLYGLPLSPAQLDEAACEGADVAVVDRLFPQLSDVERSEILWALGAHLGDLAGFGGAVAA